MDKEHPRQPLYSLTVNQLVHRSLLSETQTPHIYTRRSRFYQQAVDILSNLDDLDPSFLSQDRVINNLAGFLKRSERSVNGRFMRLRTAYLNSLPFVEQEATFQVVHKRQERPFLESLKNRFVSGVLAAALTVTVGLPWLASANGLVVDEVTTKRAQIVSKILPDIDRSVQIGVADTTSDRGTIHAAQILAQSFAEQQANQLAAEQDPEKFGKVLTNNFNLAQMQNYARIAILASSPSENPPYTQANITMLAEIGRLYGGQQNAVLSLSRSRPDILAALFDTYKAAKQLGTVEQFTPQVIEKIVAEGEGRINKLAEEENYQVTAEARTDIYRALLVKFSGLIDKGQAIERINSMADLTKFLQQDKHLLDTVSNFVSSQAGFDQGTARQLAYIIYCAKMLGRQLNSEQLTDILAATNTTSLSFRIPAGKYKGLIVQTTFERLNPTSANMA